MGDKWKLNPATDRQREFIKTLVDERGGGSAMPVEVQLDLFDLFEDKLNAGEASNLIGVLKNLPTVQATAPMPPPVIPAPLPAPTTAPVPAPAPPPGIAAGTVPRDEQMRMNPQDGIQVFVIPEVYHPGGQIEKNVIVKYQPNRDKTRGAWHRWVRIGGTRLAADGTHVNGKWLYSPSMAWYVKPEHKMTIDQAQAFILMFGKCVRCGRKLKAAESVERGIGPVCWQYFNSGWA